MRYSVINCLHSRAQKVRQYGSGQTPDPVDEHVAGPGEAGAAAEHHGGQHGVQHASRDIDSGEDYLHSVSQHVLLSSALRVLQMTNF